MGGQGESEFVVISQAPSTQVVPAKIRGAQRDLRERLLTIEGRPRGLANALDAARRGGRRRTSTSRPSELYNISEGAIQAAGVVLTPGESAALRKDAQVAAVIPNYSVALIPPVESHDGAGVKDTHAAATTWGLERLGMAKMWESSRGEGIRVAVLDTGVFGAHQTLAGRVKKFALIDPPGRRLELPIDQSFDVDGHGTHVCGTIAGGATPKGTAFGVAPAADLYVGAMLLPAATLFTVIRAINWAIEQDVDIINMSFGFPYYEPQFDVVMAQILDTYGVLPVVAIGNERHGNSSSPGNAFHSLSVGATGLGARKIDEVAGFSSGVSLVFPGQVGRELVHKPDVVAPGVDVLSCVPPWRVSDNTPSFATMSGTSMATPHVAGVAALLMGAEPEASAARIAQVLKDTAKHPDGKNFRPDNRWGYGVIDPVEALKQLQADIR